GPGGENGGLARVGNAERRGNPRAPIVGGRLAGGPVVPVALAERGEVVGSPVVLEDFAVDDVADAPGGGELGDEPDVGADVPSHHQSSGERRAAAGEVDPEVESERVLGFGEIADDRA